MSEDNHTIGETRETERYRLTDGDATVTIRKLVSNGERLEIDADSTSIKLDALLLEGLSWQTNRAAVDELLEGETSIESDPAADAIDASDAAELTAAGEESSTTTISSEYSHVAVRPVETPEGDALVITAPGRGSTITLGVQSLREIASVDDTYVFSVWFQTPFGPEDTPVEGPL